jgi:catechol 2,3-dioxygenase-like lactoylglutathione lyase family enzyme
LISGIIYFHTLARTLFDVIDMKKIFFGMTFILSFGFMKAQEIKSITMNFNHSALSVEDVDRSAAFYRKVLNLQEITNRTKKEGIRWFAIGDGKELHLVSSIKQPVTVNKAIHLAFSVSDVDFDSFIRTLNELKIAYSDWPGELNKITIRADGIKQIYFQDPDGYWIEVNSVLQLADESDIRRVLEKESATWRAGDSKGHAECWHILPYSKIVIVQGDGTEVEVPAAAMKAPIVNATGGFSVNSNYKMNIQNNKAFVLHDEVSTARDGVETFSHEIRMLEKIKGEWKLVGQSIYVDDTKL